MKTLLINTEVLEVEFDLEKKIYRIQVKNIDAVDIVVLKSAITNPKDLENVILQEY